MVGGNIFSIAFGRNLDAHSDDDGPAANATLNALANVLAPVNATAIAPSSALAATASAVLEARGGVPAAHHCIIGRACYVDSLRMTIVACCVALALGVYAGWRDLRRQRRAAAGPSVVVWESDE